MLFKRSTRSIVAGRRKKAPSVNPPAFEEPNPDSPEIPDDFREDSGLISEEESSCDWWQKWKIWILALGGILLCTLGVLLICCLGRKAPAPAEPKPTIAPDMAFVSVPASPALTELAQPGDLLQLFDASGASLESLQYVQIHSVTETALLILLAPEQVDAYFQAEIDEQLLLVVHDDPARAEQLLDLQKRINNPQIVITTEENVSLFEGATLELDWAVTIDPIEATVPPVQWISADPTVATVEDGIITAHSGGETVITARCGDAEASCSVLVDVPMEALSFMTAPQKLPVRETLNLELLIEPANASGYTITWTSSDPAIATVSDTGIVTGVAGGKVIIEASYGELTAQYALEVGYRAESVAFEESILMLQVGQVRELKVHIQPMEFVLDFITFTSSAPEVATVAPDGTVTAVAEGTATITVQYGKQKAECAVAVQGAAAAPEE